MLHLECPPNSYPITDWTMPIRSSTPMVPFDLNNQKLILWTNHLTSAEALIHLHFYEDVKLRSKATLKIATRAKSIELEYCYHEIGFPSNVSVTGNDTWTITKGTVETVISCNNVEVVRINYEEEISKRAKCFSHFVNINFMLVTVTIHDQATFAYKIEDVSHLDKLSKLTNKFGYLGLMDFWRKCAILMLSVHLVAPPIERIILINHNDSCLVLLQYIHLKQLEKKRQMNQQRKLNYYKYKYKYN